MRQSAITFTDRYSGHEVLLIEADGSSNIGLIYHPQKTTKPLPWKGDCPHCLEGRQVGLPLTLKRQIKLLCSRSFSNGFYEYLAPNNGSPYRLLLRSEGKNEWQALVTDPESNEQLEVHQRRDEPPRFSPNRRLFQSPILLRCLSFLFSARITRDREARAIAQPLITQQRKHDIFPGNRHTCLQTDWNTVLLRLQ